MSMYGMLEVHFAYTRFRILRINFAGPDINRHASMYKNSKILSIESNYGFRHFHGHDDDNIFGFQMSCGHYYCVCMYETWIGAYGAASLRELENQRSEKSNSAMVLLDYGWYKSHWRGE